MEDDLSEESLTLLATWLGEQDLAVCTRLNRPPQKQVRELVRDYDVHATCSRILAFARGAETFSVALQFPDELLPHAPLVCEALRLQADTHVESESSGRETPTRLFFYILGDTSYGECCVDEVAAEHLTSNLVVHYGGACLSPTRTLPVLYVFPRFRFASPEFVREKFREAVSGLVNRDEVDRLVVLYDVELFQCFKSGGFRVDGEECVIDGLHKEIEFASLRLGDHERVMQPGEEAVEGREAQVSVGPLAFRQGSIPIGRTAFLWCTRSDSADEWPAAARNAALQLCTGPQDHCAGFYGVSLTESSDTEPRLVDASRVLRKRFAVMNKVNEAQRVGIVPGTLGVSGNLEVIDRCKRIIKSAEKRSYVILVGKPNPSKLGNFAEIEVFVLVACPQNALLDGRDYLQPIITPFELEAALLSDGDIFSSPYSVDFRDVLKNKLELEEEENGEGDGSGEGESGRKETSIALRGDWSVSVTGEGGAAEFLQSRHWQGLSFDTGGTDDSTQIAQLPLKAAQGQSGIASKYDDEEQHARGNEQSG